MHRNLKECDDGWGYMVLDENWESESVKPAQEKNHTFKRLIL